MQDPDAARGLWIVYGVLPEKTADWRLAGIAPPRFQHVAMSHGALVAVLPNVRLVVGAARALRRSARPRVALFPIAGILRIVAARAPPAEVTLQYQAALAARAAINAIEEGLQPNRHGSSPVSLGMAMPASAFTWCRRRKCSAGTDSTRSNSLRSAASAENPFAAQ